ncbi:hypothetical protein L1049_011133 [Liquidambar formosana]|uniref:RNase H type-1 domain-containing protein n=1 Tax=Liquidambar formosana TaxID=63359 RepID=A0AAP0X1S5_LIQFO
MDNTQSDLLVLHSLGVSAIPKKAPIVSEVCWHPPIWLKLNTDGLAKGNPGPTVAGGVFRNCRGFVKGIFSFNIGIQSAFYAELLAVILGIEQAWDKGWFQIWLESDSLSVIQCLSNPDFTPPWSLRVRWQNCKTYLRRMRFQFSHIFREGNAMADKVANLGVNYLGFQWWSAAPSSLNGLLCRDMCGMTFYRFKS